MTSYIKAGTEVEQGEESICKDIVENHRGEVNELLEVQEEEGKEAWMLLVESPNRTRATQIRLGRQSEIDNGDVEEAVDDFDFTGVKRITFIHTHPEGNFLSPDDIATHAKFVRRFDAYEATAGVYKDGDEVEVFSAENTNEIQEHEKADMISILEQYQHTLEQKSLPSEFYVTVSEMFDEMDRFMDYCESSYTRR